MELILILGILIALLFNFANGMNDAANSIATVVATRVLTPLQAVLMAAGFNLIGPLLFTTAVAKTIGKGIVNPPFMTIHVFFIGILIASIWVLLTTFSGLPISATHALIGGIMGAAVGAGGLQACPWPSLLTIGTLFLYIAISALVGAIIFASIARIMREETWKGYLGLGAVFGSSLIVPLLMITGIVSITGILAILIFIVFSPLLGFIAAYVSVLVVMRLFSTSNLQSMNSVFNKLQVVSAAFYSLNHGSNDAQNAMGAITAMLVAAGILHEFTVPVWVILLSCTAIALGTFMGGWNVVKTMAKKITHIRPYQGFCAETGGGIALTFITTFGIPVSTTHAISGAITGVGATHGYSAIQWNVVRRIVMAWILTIPVTAITAFVVYLVYRIVLL
ncbi:MAG: inorganic phosphate transporter [Methanomicrobiales archaeon]|nr:inorganic phosphate transporter [Methanomicrobiales archaeon]